MKYMSGVSKNFKITIWLESEKRNLTKWEPDLALFKYLIYQLERGKCGKLHVQGYAQVAKATRNTTLARLIGLDAHVECRKGTHEEAVNYVTKEDTRVEGPFEYGTPAPGQGSRTDINQLMSMPIKDISIQFPEIFFKYSRGIIARRDWSQPNPTYQKWEVAYIRRDQLTDKMYHVRLERKSVIRDGRLDIEWIDHWDYYDYEEIAVSEQPIEWRPFVKSIYRGYIPNRVKTLYIIDVTSVTSCVGNTGPHNFEPEDNLRIEQYPKDNA